MPSQSFSLFPEALSQSRIVAPVGAIRRLAEGIHPRIKMY